MVSPVCDTGSGTGSLLCYGIGTGKWQWYESTPVADIAVNRHQSSISSLESLKYFEVPTTQSCGFMSTPIDLVQLAKPCHVSSRPLT